MLYIYYLIFIVAVGFALYEFGIVANREIDRMFENHK